MLTQNNKRAVGLDIADRTIEVVELSATGKSLTLKSAGRVTMKSGIVVRGRIVDKDKLAVAVKKAFACASPDPIEIDKIAFGLPESQVYTRVFFATLQSANQVEDSVIKEIKKSIPIDVDNLVYSTRILSKNKIKSRGKGTRFEILIVAVERDVVREWRDFFDSISATCDEFDIETIATARGLMLGDLKKPICVVDMGSSSTTISIFDKNGLQFSFSSDVAGDFFTKQISKTLGISIEDADKLKKAHGIDNPDEKVFAILVKHLESIQKDIKSALSYFKRKTGLGVDEVILVGGSSQLKGLDKYLSKNLKVRVGRGESPMHIKKQTKANQLFYVSAIGLALRNINAKYAKNDLLIPCGTDFDVSLDEEVGVDDVALKPLAKKNDMEFLGSPDKKFITPEYVHNREKRKEIKFFWSVVIILFVGLSSVWWLMGVVNNESPIYKVSQPVNAPIKVVDLNSLYVAPTSTPDVAEQVNGIEENLTEDSKNEDVIETLPTATILDTPTGWLRVRAAAGTEFSEIDKINPGEKYDVLDELDGWVKIKLDDVREGWVYGQYVSVSGG